MQQTTNVIRNHKDTVFRMLFREKKALLQLYNALNRTSYADESKLEVYTLENAVYMSVKNDVSFLFCSELNLFEHQGSFSPNVPLRDLSYIARQLERYTKDAAIYSGSQVKIPTPRFVVFYNGTTQQPDKRILRLSDAYEKKTPDPDLELKVLMLNINYGKNRELMERCETLKGYSIFVERIRKYARTESIDTAVDRTVEECIREGILADFLSVQRAEVKAMSIFEYNEEEERRKTQKADREMGLEMGRRVGYREGRKEGRKEGLTEGLAESVLILLTGLGEFPVALQERIKQETDQEKLRAWIGKAAKAESLTQFLAMTGLLDERDGRSAEKQGLSL